MKLFRRASALAMVLALLLSMSISVFAASFDNMDDGFAYDGEDTDVNITLSEDVNNGWYEAKEGKNYNIGTNNGSTLNSVGFSGSGDVVIDTDVTGLNASEDVHVTVNGDVAGVDNEYGYTDGDGNDVISGGAGVYAENNATVTVNGDVTGGNADGEGSKDIAYGGAGVSVNENASVTVNGDVTGGTATGAGENLDGEAVWAYSEDGDSPSVTVNGDVTGENGVGAIGAAEITVTGDVTGNSIGVMADDGASITVTGDVSGKWIGVDARGDNTTVTVNGNVAGADGIPDEVDYADPTGWSDGGIGMDVYEGATVHVSGDVTGGDAYGTYGYAGDAIHAGEGATVSVGGNVSGGSVTADPNTEVHVDEDGMAWHSEAGDGIEMDSSASVTVGGNVSGGSTSGDAGTAGFGATIMSKGDEAGALIVGGDVTCGSAPDNGSTGAGLAVAVVEGAPAPSITVGSYDSIMAVVVNTEAGAYREMTEEELDTFKETIKIAPKGESVPADESLWNNVLGKIHKAKPGEEVVLNFYGRRTIPAFVIEAARKYDVKLIIKWDGGDDLVITKDFTAEVKGNILLKDLAEMLKK